MNSRLSVAAAVFAGGVFGTSLRFAASESFAWFGWSTLLSLLVVNVLGAFGLGWYVARSQHSSPIGSSLHAFIAVGLLGSFTTFAAFSVETVELVQRGLWLAGGSYAVASIAAGVAAASVARTLAVRS